MPSERNARANSNSIASAASVSVGSAALTLRWKRCQLGASVPEFPEEPKKSNNLRDLEDDLAECGIALEVSVSIGNLIEAENAIDHRPHDTACEQWADLRSKGLRGSDFLFEASRAQDRPAYRQSLPQNYAEGYRGIAAAHRANENDAPLRRSSGNARRKVGATNEIEHHLDTGPVGERRDASGDVVRVTVHDDAFLEAERASAIDLLAGTGVTNWNRASRPCELQRREADTASHGVNEDVLRHVRVGLRHERIVRGDERFGNGSGLGPREIRRNGGKRSLVRDDVLRISSTADDTVYAIALLPERRTSAARRDLAGDLHPWNVGWPTWRRGIAPLTLQKVGAIEGGRAHANEDFARARLRSRNISYLEHFGSTGARDDGGAHACRVRGHLSVLEESRDASGARYDVARRAAAA